MDVILVTKCLFYFLGVTTFCVETGCDRKAWKYQNNFPVGAITSFTYLPISCSRYSIKRTEPPCGYNWES